MAKNIVVCCDGTGNEFGDNNSNVVKLCSMLVTNERQVTYYHPGVGTMGSPTARTQLGKGWDVVRGLAFGYGITDNIADAYRYLMETYEAEDRIFLFGFSRGAYTARALGGLLHMFGLLHPGNEGLIPYITEKFATHTKQAQGMTHTFQVAEGFKRTYCQDVLLHFVGVWDTVSSVGWISDPLVIPYTANNPIMKTGRHAVSLDERRCFFRDNLWGPPLQPSDPAYRVPQDIKQVWFAGVHSDVGGSYPEGESGLSKITLEWMLREAWWSGLRIDDEKAKHILGLVRPTPFVPPDPTDGQHESLHGAWWLAELLPHYKYDKRKGKQHWTWPPLGVHRHLPPEVVVHQSVLDRIRDVKAYHPKNLLDEPITIHAEPYRPLFPDVPPVEHPDGRHFSELNARDQVQAILDLKVDASPLLDAPPDMWPRYPVLAAVVSVAAILAFAETWETRLLDAVVALAIFLLVFRGFRKLYNLGLIEHYEKYENKKDGVISPKRAPEAPPYVRPAWKATNQFVAGLIAAGVFLCVASRSVVSLSPLIQAAVAVVIVAAGIFSAWATIAKARAFNALCSSWDAASNNTEFREYKAAQTQRANAASAPAPREWHE